MTSLEGCGSQRPGAAETPQSLAQTGLYCLASGDTRDEVLVILSPL
jgi:hypothetical protein